MKIKINIEKITSENNITLNGFNNEMEGKSNEVSDLIIEMLKTINRLGPINIIDSNVSSSNDTTISFTLEKVNEVLDKIQEYINNDSMFLSCIPRIVLYDYLDLLRRLTENPSSIESIGYNHKVDEYDYFRFYTPMQNYDNIMDLRYAAISNYSYCIIDIEIYDAFIKIQRDLLKSNRLSSFNSALINRYSNVFADCRNKINFCTNEKENK